MWRPQFDSYDEKPLQLFSVRKYILIECFIKHSFQIPELVEIQFYLLIDHSGKLCTLEFHRETHLEVCLKVN